MECTRQCEFPYHPADPAQVRKHDRYHDEVSNGVYARPAKSDEVIWKQGRDRITVMRHRTALRAQRERAWRAAFAANREMRYDGGVYCAEDPPDERDLHVFLPHRGNRIVGLLIMERRTPMWSGTWDEFDESKASNAEPQSAEQTPVWSVGFVWVLPRHRREGLARRLVLEGCAFLGAQVEHLGWYVPFMQSGEALVRKLCPVKLYLVA